MRNSGTQNMETRMEVSARKYVPLGEGIGVALCFNCSTCLSLWVGWIHRLSSNPVHLFYKKHGEK